MKKILAILLVTFLFAGVCGVTAALAADKQFRVAFSLPPIRNDFHGRMRVVIDEAIAEVLAERNDFEFNAINANDENHQYELLEMFMNDNYDLIAIMPSDATLLAPIIAEIYNSGTPVIVINRNLPTPTYTHFIAGDNVDGGRVAAHYIGNFFTEPAEIVMVRMNVGTPIGEERHSGFMEEIVNYPHIKILGEAASGPTREQGLEDMANLLSAFPHIDGVYTHDDETALGAIEAIRDANRTEIQVMTGFGGVRGVLEGYQNADRPWPESVLKGTALYSPYMGADAVHLAVDVLNGVEHPQMIIQPSILVTSENIDQYIHLGY
jgi:ribose transport system substrate-binding protein